MKALRACLLLLVILVASATFVVFDAPNAGADPLTGTCVPTSSAALFPPGSPCNACPFYPAPNTLPCEYYPQLPTNICSLGAAVLNGYPYGLPYSSAGLYPFANDPVTANLAALSRHSTSVCNPAANQTSVPAPTPTPPPASKIRIASTPAKLSCGETGYVKVEILDAAGGFIETGQSVTVATDLGSITPSSGIETGGTFYALLTVPNSGAGTATVTATSSGVKGTGQVQFNCVGGPALVSAAAVPASVAAVTSTQVRSEVRFAVDSFCAGSRADANVVWTGNDAASTQWVDVSSASSWAPGSFAGSGPHGSSLNSLSVTNLQPAYTYYVRHNQPISGGWKTSQTYSFTTPPC